MSVQDFEVKQAEWPPDSAVGGLAIARKSDGATVFGPIRADSGSRIELLDTPEGATAHVYMQPHYRIVLMLEGPLLLKGHTYAYVRQEAAPAGWVRPGWYIQREGQWFFVADASWGEPRMSDTLAATLTVAVEAGHLEGE